mgnify:CR=1 FL=1
MVFFKENYTFWLKKEPKIKHNPSVPISIVTNFSFLFKPRAELKYKAHISAPKIRKTCFNYYHIVKKYIFLKETPPIYHNNTILKHTFQKVICCRKIRILQLSSALELKANEKITTIEIGRVGTAYILLFFLISSLLFTTSNLKYAKVFREIWILQLCSAPRSNNGWRIHHNWD